MKFQFWPGEKVAGSLAGAVFAEFCVSKPTDPKVLRLLTKSIETAQQKDIYIYNNKIR